MASKPEDGKQGAETDDEAAFTKVKSPRQRPKVTKPTCEKTSTPKSLSLNRTGCLRKQVGGKMGSSPLPSINDQEAMAVPLSSEEDKPPTLELSMFSNILQTEPKNEREDQSPSKNSCDAEQENNAPGMESDDIKEEDVSNDVLNCDINKENVDSKMTNQGKEGVEDDVKIEDDAPEDVTMADLSNEREKECIESNSNISGVCSMNDNKEVSTDDIEGPSWTRDEDRVILCTFQSSEPDKMKTLAKISAQLPLRTVDEVIFFS